MFSRIKMLRPTGRGDPPERNRVAHCGDERREIIGSEKNSMKLMEILLRNFENFPACTYSKIKLIKLFNSLLQLE